MGQWGSLSLAVAVGTWRLRKQAEEAGKGMQLLIAQFRHRNSREKHDAGIVVMRYIMSRWARVDYVHVLYAWRLHFRQAITLSAIAQSLHAQRSVPRTESDGDAAALRRGMAAALSGMRQLCALEIRYVCGVEARQQMMGMKMMTDSGDEASDVVTYQRVFGLCRMQRVFASQSISVTQRIIGYWRCNKAVSQLERQPADERNEQALTSPISPTPHVTCLR